MYKIISELLSFFKYTLFIISFILINYCIFITYQRLNKPLYSNIEVFIPFVLVFFIFVVSLLTKNKNVKTNILFNFVSTFVFLVIIIICLRSLFDTNMLLYFKYNIKFNPTYFSDNLFMIEIMLYMLFISNIIILISNKFEHNKKEEKPIILNEKEEIL